MKKKLVYTQFEDQAQAKELQDEELQRYLDNDAKEAQAIDEK